VRLHFTKGKDATIMSLSFPHCIFDGVGFVQIAQAWGEVLEGRGEGIVSNFLFCVFIDFQRMARVLELGLEVGF